MPKGDVKKEIFLRGRCVCEKGEMVYKTCRFSQLLLLESLCQTRLSKPLTLRDVVVLEPLQGLLPCLKLPPVFRPWCRRLAARGSGCSCFSRICVKMPTNSSSTLWLIATEVSIYLQSQEVAMHLPSAQKIKNTFYSQFLHLF